MTRPTGSMGYLISALALAACTSPAAGAASASSGNTASCTTEVHVVSWDWDYDGAQSEKDVIDPNNEDASHYRSHDCTYADEVLAKLKGLQPLESTAGATADVRLVAIVTTGTRTEEISVPRMCDWIGLNRDRKFRFNPDLLQLLMRLLPEHEREAIRKFPGCFGPKST